MKQLKLPAFLSTISRIPRPIRILVGILVGAGAGYLYYSLVGCSTGSCPITSSPVNSTLYGAFVGLMLALT